VSPREGRTTVRGHYAGGVKRVLVFCGSSPGVRADYVAQAEGLGRLLAARRLELVYGGARVGLMGALADSALAGGGTVIGVIPDGVIEREVAHTALTELHVVETMHQRKALMAELSDAVIALPGGLGTLDELIELLTWKQIGLHGKPIGVLDVGGYWQPFVQVLQHAVAEGFLRAEDVDGLLVESQVAVLLDRLAGHEQSAVAGS
jgi:uncharacterized protein (TIGR00730 family)